MEQEKEKAGGAGPLDSLIGEASANPDIAAPLPGAEPGAAEVAPVDAERVAWVEMARQGCGLVAALFPALKEDWKPELVDNFGGALADCMKHYGVTRAGAVSHPLVVLAFASLPLAIPAYQKVIKPLAQKQSFGERVKAWFAPSKRADAAPVPAGKSKAAASKNDKLPPAEE